MEILNTIKGDYSAIKDILISTGEPSYANDLNRYFIKIMVLSSASLCEHELTSALVEFSRKLSNSDERLMNFLRKQAISQRYHQLFDWGEQDNPENPSKSGKKFFKLFGNNFSENVTNEINKDPQLKIELEDFLHIGHLRNIIVHSNFAEYDLENLTADEILKKGENAFNFIQYIKTKLTT